ncbi:DIP1984 family protein [Desemzia sp. FAM 23991]|uniref:DIP1984 family protein n=1 Tax=unclassified Desemzia TaxID=2685243 RepID=UPI0038885133
MKLAEALLLRRDLEAKLTSLKQEILANALIQEGDSLDISMDELIQDYQKTNEEFSQLVVKINQRNSSANLYDTDKLIVEALEERESLRRQHGLLNNTIETANDIRRFGRNEIRMVRTVDTKELTKKMNVVSKKLRELDGQIQQTNWLVDL